MTDTQQAAPTREPVTTAYAQEVCRMGQGAACCRYLTMAGARGWSCEKHGAFRADLDQRATRGAMVARGDNCEGRLCR